MENTSLFGKVVACLGALVLLLIACFAGSLFEHVDAGEIVVIQSLGMAGKSTLTVYTDAGWKWQGCGKVTHLQKSFQHWFSSKNDQGSQQDESLRIRFNDGGHATISGSIRVDLPVDDASVIDLVTHFSGQQAIDHELIRTVIEKSAYMTGPLMSSKESYAEKRTDLINFIEDQAKNGVYRTVPKAAKIIDPVSGQERTATVVDLKVGADGKLEREEPSPLIRYNIKLYNLGFNEIKYDDVVEKQIASQQDAIMQVQTAIAQSKKAEQEALTVAKQGEAQAAKAKWEQEVIKAKMVTEAQQQLEVAKLNRDAAEQTKAQQILLGEGEATRKKLQMDANGALDPKLDAWIRVNEMYANALKEIKQPIVPAIVMGGGGSAGSNSGVDLIEMLKVRTAQQLALDIGMQKK